MAIKHHIFTSIFMTSTLNSLPHTSNQRAKFLQRFERNNVNVLDVLPAKVFHLKWAFGGNGSHGMCPAPPTS